MLRIKSPQLELLSLGCHYLVVSFTDGVLLGTKLLVAFGIEGIGQARALTALMAFKSTVEAIFARNAFSSLGVGLWARRTLLTDCRFICAEKARWTIKAVNSASLVQTLENE